MPAKERDVIIRRGQLEAEAEKLKEIKLKKEKEKKAKAESAEKKKSEANSHKDPPKDGGRKKKKKSNRELKESSSKDGSKDAAVGVGTLRGDWICIPATHEPRKLNHVNDHGDRACSTATRDANGLINFKKYNNVSPATPRETSTNIPSDDDGQ